MSFLREPRLPGPLKAYGAAIMMLGLPVFVYSLRHSLVDFSWMWLVLCLLCASAALFPIRLPTRGADSFTVTVGDVFVFSAILLLGPEQAVPIAVLDGLVSSPQNRGYRKLFNISVLSLVVFTAGHFLYFLLGAEPPLRPDKPPEMTLFSLSLAATAAVFYVFNSGAVAWAISLSSGQSLGKIWKTNFVWSSLATLAGASVAALVFLTSGKAWIYGAVFGVPLVLVIYNAYRLNLERVNEAERHASVVSRLYDSAIASLATAIDAKDQCTHGHLERVQVLALGLARLSGVRDEQELEALRAASLLHDIGKLGIPEHILNKPTGLTEWEIRKMRTHPDVGADILSSVPFPYPVVPIVRSHHERWDGGGYPQGLKGEEIPLGARILAVADCYDALRSDRPYRRRLSTESTVDYIVSQSGKAYDPFLVQVLVANSERLEREMAQAVNHAPKRALKARAADLSPPLRAPRRPPSPTLFHETAGRKREIERLRQMSTAFGRSCGLAETLAILTAKVRSLVQSDAVAIYLLDSEQGTFVPEHVEGDHAEDLARVRIGWGEGITGWVAANRQPLIDVHPRPEFAGREFLQAAFNGCLAVPLYEDDAVLGVITLYTASDRPYGEEDLRLMQTLAHFSVSVITNALIHEEGQSEKFTDELTGLPDMRYFRVFCQSELKRSREAGYPVSLVIVQLEEQDRLKREFGYPAASRALCETAHLLRRQIRKTDLCSRKADRFQILMPGLGRNLLQTTLQRILKSLDEHRLQLEAGLSIPLRYGVGSATSSVDGGDLGALERTAERTLGRDRERRRQVRESAAVLPFDKRELGR